jgi:hypothetical protein
VKLGRGRGDAAPLDRAAAPLDERRRVAAMAAGEEEESRPLADALPDLCEQVAHADTLFLPKLVLKDQLSGAAVTREMDT